MQYITLGTSNLRVSRLALGCMSFGSPAWRDWALTEEESRPILQRAFEGMEAREASRSQKVDSDRP